VAVLAADVKLMGAIRKMQAEHKATALANACSRVFTDIQRLKSSLSRPVVVALDEGSGSGKSTLAALIAQEIGVVVIPVDDFYAADIPERQWDAFSVEERLARVFHWQRLRETAIKPLLNGKPARWYAFDFVSGLRDDGTYGMQSEPVVLEPADVILLDGAYSAGPELCDMVDLAVLIDVPVGERHARLAPREDQANWGPDSTFSSAEAAALVRQVADADAEGMACLRQIVDIL